MSKEKILITGARGFIGQYVQKLLINDYEILTIKENLFTIDMNVYMQEYQPDYLIHLAWVTGDGYINSQENLLMVSKSIEMYHAFFNHGGKRAVYVGTEQEYERTNSVLFSISSAIFCKESKH